MEAAERQVVIDGLASSEARLLALVEGLTPAQWNFHETPERWSIAENIEHVIAVDFALTVSRDVQHRFVTALQIQQGGNLGGFVKRDAVLNDDRITEKGG